MITVTETKTELKERVQDYIMARVHDSFVTTMEDGYSDLESPEAQAELTKQIKRVQKLFGFTSWNGLDS